MYLGKLLRGGAVVAAILLGLQLDAAADPITYEGTLTNGVPAAGSIPPSSSFDDARDADYWRFWATAGDSVTVIVERSDTQLDPALFTYKGLYGDTLDVGLTNGTNNLSNGTMLLGFADDELPDPGPWGDPQFTFTAPVTGWYTAAATEFLSDPLPQDKRSYDYEITVRGNTGSPVPEPSLLALLTCGAFGVAFRRRRKAAA